MRSLVVLLAFGCSGSNSNEHAGPTTMRLISGDYSLAAGQEKFICVRKTIATDLLITEITPVNALATHHHVLGIDLSSTAPDGTAECRNAVEFDVLKWKMLFASGVNSPG